MKAQEFEKDRKFKIKTKLCFGLRWDLCLYVFKNNIIEIKFTCQNNHPFNVYHQMAFSLFTELWKHHHDLILHFYHPERNFYCL